MSQKQAKKIRKKLREESALVSVGSEGPLSPMILEQRQRSAALPKRLLMRRKDPSPNELGPRLYRGGAILHPMSERAVYQFAKKKGAG